MKKVIVSTIVLMGFLMMTCQRGNVATSKSVIKDFCGVDEAYTYDSYLDKIIQLQQKYPIKNKRVLTFPVQIYLIAPPSKCSITQEEITAAFNNLNQTFKDLQIQFKPESEVFYIYDKTRLDDLYDDQNAETNFTKKIYNQRVLNLYICQNYESIVGFTHYPILNINRLFIARDKLNDSALIHEMGHFFGLLHTFEHSLSTAEKINDPDCDKNGDKICDTPADISGASFLEDECKLFGEYKDVNGNTFSPDLSNFMSYYGKCRSRFTTEQIERMYFIALYVKWQQMKLGV